jgi:hypothetical protein
MRRSFFLAESRFSRRWNRLTTPVAAMIGGFGWPAKA